MAWTKSGIFYEFGRGALLNLAAFDLDAETHKVALFGNAVTPAFDASAADTAYGAGQWSLANEVSGTNWPVGGVALTSTTVTNPSAGQLRFDAADTSVATTTITGAYGALVYADALTTPVADQGIMGIWFGGASYSTVAGTFTIQYGASGLFYLTLTP